MTVWDFFPCFIVNLTHLVVSIFRVSSIQIKRPLSSEKLKNTFSNYSIKPLTLSKSFKL